MRILVTGGAGFIGSHTVRLLLERQKEFGCSAVGVIDNFTTGLMSNLPLHENLAVFKMDIRSKAKLETAFQAFQPNAVIHLAAEPSITTSWEKPDRAFQINTVGTLNIIEMCDIFHVPDIVFASTSAIYGTNLHQDESYFENCRQEGHPADPYGLSKWTAEECLRMFARHKATILRYGNVFGPGQVPIGENQIIPRAILHLLGKAPNFEIFGSGEQTRDLVYIEDVAVANILAAFNNGPAGTFNIASGESRSVNEILKYLDDGFGRKTTWKHGPERDNRPSVRMDIKQASKILRWWPTVTFESGIASTVRWWLEKEGAKG